MDLYNSDEIKYIEARKRVKQMKGFYTHLIIFICVNLFIAYFNYENLKPGASYFELKNFLTLFFWGIGLTAHGFSVFMPQFLFGKDWEEKKIHELMDKYK